MGDGPAAPPPRFAFVVHPLSEGMRRVLGLRRARPGLALGRRPPRPADVGPVARVGVAGVAEGIVVAVPLTPAELLDDQARAVAWMERAVRVAEERAGPLAAVGLGSLCAVVGSRGEALAERLDVPVTTGAAATAWALVEAARAAVERRGGGPVAVVGSGGPVGYQVARALATAGLRVRVDGRRGGRGLDVEVADGPAAAVAGCPVVVGAGPTGGSVPADALAPGTLVVDVAIPPTVRGRARRWRGEALSVPRSWRTDAWGPLYQLLAGYGGPRRVAACVVEPLVLAAARRDRPLALGRRVEPDAVALVGRTLGGLGFRPVHAPRSPG